MTMPEGQQRPEEPGRPADVARCAPPDAADGLRMAPDAVDDIIAAWRRERPDLPVEAMEVWSRVTRLSRRLDRARSRACATAGLEIWEFDVLAALRRAGEPYRLSPGALLAELEVTSGTMTNRVSRLADRGLVERRPNPEDGRGVIVVLTTQGCARVDWALEELLASEGRLLGAMDAARVADLGRTLRVVLARQEELDRDDG